MILLHKLLCVLPAVLVLILGLWVLPSPVPAQEPHHRSARLAGAEDVQLTVLVDGSINPEMIPEDVAYSHFFRALARDPGLATSVDDRRRSAYIKFFFRKDCGPNKEDRTLTDSQAHWLLIIADRLQERVAVLDASLRAAGTSPGSESAAEQRQALLREAIVSVNADGDAAPKVRAHIANHVKRKIKHVQVVMPGMK